jgi:hypothetical protein
MPNTLNELIDDVDRVGGIQAGRFSDADKMRAMTIAARTINQEVTKVMRDYDYQGERSFHDLVANQREYLNPTDLLKIKRIDLKLDGTNWKKANWIDESEIGDKYVAEADIISRFTNTEPKISFFDESYFIWSGTIANVTDGIQITYDKDIVGVNSSGTDIQDFSATTDVPNLIGFAQQALVLWAIIEWYGSHLNSKKLIYFNNLLWGNPKGRPQDDRQIGGLMRQILDYYSDRTPDRPIEFQSQYNEEDFS